MRCNGGWAAGARLLCTVGIVLAWPRVARGQAADTASSDPFVHYATPGECANVAPRLERQYWNSHRPDTVVQAPAFNPARPEAVAAARRCVARFTVATTPARDLLGLGAAYLGASQVPQADSAFQRWLTLLAARPAEQRWALVQIVGAYANARPARLDKASGYLARLDALGRSAAQERLLAHVAVLRTIQHADSTALQAAEVAAALTASRQLQGDTARMMAAASADAFAGLADLRGRQGDGAGALAVLDQGEAELNRLCPSNGLLGPRKDIYRLWGRPAPAVSATRWFNDSTGGQRPSLGRRSLVVFAHMDLELMTFPTYAVLRRLKAANPDLDVTFVIRTEGRFRAQVLGPAAEIERNRSYFLEDQQLPVSLAIWETVFRRRAVDHGLQAQQNPNRAAYGPFQAYLVDRRGIVRMIGDLDPYTEIRWRNVLAEMP